MASKNNSFVMRKINTADIISNAGYQRPVQPRDVRRIVAHWDDNLVNPPKVSYRDGKFYVFDGQHTINALKLRNDGNDVDVVCRIYTGLTYEDEARLFAEQNGISRNVTAHQKIKALYEAEDRDVVSVVDIVSRYGYPNVLSVDCGSKVFRSLPTALNIYRKYGHDRLVNILDVVTTAWGLDKYGCRSGILNGINIVLETYRSEITPAELARSLSKVSPAKIGVNARADTTHRGASRYAFQMVLVYNKKRHYRIDERDIR